MRDVTEIKSHLSSHFKYTTGYLSHFVNHFKIYYCLLQSTLIESCRCCVLSSHMCGLCLLFAYFPFWLADIVYICMCDALLSSISQEFHHTGLTCRPFNFPIDFHPFLKAQSNMIPYQLLFLYCLLSIASTSLCYSRM